jgi:hypothetical protein
MPNTLYLDANATTEVLPEALAAAARAMEPVILLLRRTVHFKRGFSASLLTLFLLFLPQQWQRKGTRTYC